MPKIRLLQPEVAEMIAAGEVIDRPASIVKELVENAVDAGATRIDVELSRGGIALIRVSDNGGGMDKEDLALAFLRHATSKVQTKEDLSQIATLGFRGEALASIAAVSRVVVSSRTQHSDVGAKLCIEGGMMFPVEDAGCRAGTTVEVRDLFFNTPARMKFLRRDVTEANAVSLLLEQLALGNPNIAFGFVREGKKVLQTPGDGNLRALVRVLRGAQLAQQMIELEGFWEGITINGLISKPTVSRQTRSLQSFFINGRYVRSKTCANALEDAYKNRLMQGRFPACVLYVGIGHGHVDVNVHPAKLEVRFSSEQDVYNAVNTACLSALTRQESKSAGSEASLNPFALQQDRIFGREVLSSGFTTVRDASDLTTQLPALDAGKWILKSKEESSAAKQAIEGSPSGNDAIFVDSTGNTPQKASHHAGCFDKTPGAQDEKNPPFTVLGEIFNTFIAVQQQDCFYLIDKHAAHERYVYEQLRQIGQAGTDQRQLLLSPEVVVLPRDEFTVLSENPETLMTMGIAGEPFGDNTFLIREIAVVLDGCDLADLLIQVAKGLKRLCSNPTPAAIDEILYSVACRAAVMAGIKSPVPELQKLAELVLKEGIRHCPHGRPAAVRFSRYEVEKMFGRKD